MSILTLNRFALAAALAVSVLIALALTAQAQESAGTVEILAIDVDTAGNSPDSIGEVDVCTELAVGAETDVDIVVRGIPEIDGPGGELEGFDFRLNFDARYLEIVSVDVEGQLLGALPGSNVVDFSSPTRDEPTKWTIAAAEFGIGAEESGDGVLARMTVRGVDVGTSDLDFDGNIILQDTSASYYEIETIQNALVAVGVDCAPGVTPPAVATDAPTSAPETANPDGSTPGPDDTPDGGSSPGDTGGANSPGDDDTPGPGESPGEGNGVVDDDDDGGSSSGLLIAGILAAVVIVIGGGGFYLWQNRRTPTV